MLSNAYFLAKFCFDTAENEPAKNLQSFANFANFADPHPLAAQLAAQQAAEQGPDLPLTKLPPRDPAKSRLRSEVNNSE